MKGGHRDGVAVCVSAWHSFVVLGPNPGNGEEGEAEEHGGDLVYFQGHSSPGIYARAFFEGLGIKTRLSGYELGRDAVDAVVGQLKAHGMIALGEHKDIDLEVSRTILEAAL